MAINIFEIKINEELNFIGLLLINVVFSSICKTVYLFFGVKEITI